MAKSDATRSVLRGFGTRGTKRHDNRRLWNNKSHILMQFGVPVMQALLGEDLRSLSRKETKLLKQRFRGRFQPTDDVVLETLREIGDSGFGSSETIAPVLPKAQGCQMETVNGNAILEATKTNVSSDEILPDIVCDIPSRPCADSSIAATLPRRDLSGCEKGLPCSGQRTTVNTFQSKENVPDIHCEEPSLNPPVACTPWASPPGSHLPGREDHSAWRGKKSTVHPTNSGQQTEPSTGADGSTGISLSTVARADNSTLDASILRTTPVVTIHGQRVFGDSMPRSQVASAPSVEDIVREVRQQIQYLNRSVNAQLQQQIQHMNSYVKEELKNDFQHLSNQVDELRAIMHANVGAVLRTIPKHAAPDNTAAASLLLSLAGER